MANAIKTCLGVDWGTKRIGIAIGDTGTRLASPFKVIEDLEELLSMIIFEEINELVIGKPLKMYEAMDDFSREYIEFVDLLEKNIEIPVIKIDERLTSKQADSLIGDKKTKASRDSLAAMLILQSYFDMLDNNIKF